METRAHLERHLRSGIYETGLIGGGGREESEPLPGFWLGLLDIVLGHSLRQGSLEAQVAWAR